ncbi:hypothetical protein LO763_19775 [Glycomyces sp. A-F 0318]|uniref:hypothetical protein n=1 Tax=Glycomyces amatae TaxID=2881355 RepID=UPI001E3F04D6|nr:hypothetical protein [Glycomyces amatae]MCD0445852.1 hypothetical protein [Glycomyces amatae]
MHTRRDLQELIAAADLVEQWSHVYWQAGHDGTAAFDATLAGENVAAARERWLGMVAAVDGLERAVAFGRAANEYLEANQAVGVAEAHADQCGRTYDAGIETGEARHRRHVAHEALCQAARPRAGGGTAVTAAA